MKIKLTLIALVSCLAFPCFAQEEGAPSSTVQEKPSCVLKAEAKGKTCRMKCCRDAAKEGKVCEKCLKRDQAKKAKAAKKARNAPSDAAPVAGEERQ